MADTIRSIEALETAIEEMLNAVRVKFRADAATFHYYDESCDRLILPVGVGLRQPERFRTWVPSMGRVAGKIIRSGQPVVAQNAEEHPDAAGPFVYAEGIKSSAGFCATSSDSNKTGLVFVNYRIQCALPEAETEAMQQKADSIADQVQKWLASEPNLRTALSTQEGSRREQETLYRLAAETREAIGNIAVAIWTPRLRREDQDQLVVFAQSGLDEQTCTDAKLSLSRPSPIADAFAQLVPSEGDALEGKALSKVRAKEMRLKVVHAFPLVSQGRGLGVLAVYPKDRDTLTNQEKVLARAFAGQASAALEYQYKILDLTALHDFGTSLAFWLKTLPESGPQLVELAAHVVRADSASVHLYNPDRNDFEPFAQSWVYNLRPYDPEDKPRLEGISWRIVRQGIVHVGDTEKAEDPSERLTKNVTDSGVRSCIGIRLNAGEDIIGVIIFNYNRPRTFSTDDITLARICSTYAAAAIKNARMYKQLGTLGDIGLALSSVMREGKDQRQAEAAILELIHERAGEFMDTKNMYVALYDESTATVRFPLAFVDGSRMDIETRRMGLGKTEEIIRTGKPLFHASKAESEAWYRSTGHREYIDNPLASWIGVPMVVGEKTIGVIATYHPTQDNVYDSDDLATLEAMASQTAIALDNANLYCEVNRRLKALLDSARALSLAVSGGERQILDLIRKHAKDVMDTDNMYVALYDETKDTVRFPLVFVEGKRVNTRKEQSWQPRKPVGSKTEEILRTQRPLLHLTKAESEAWYRQPGRVETTGGLIWPSWLGVPMIVGEKAIGVIATYHTTLEYHYDPDDLGILQALAGQAAIALENARLLKRQKALVDFARAVTPLIDKGEKAILDSVHKHAKRVMDTDNLYIALYDADTDTARFPIAFESGTRRKWPSLKAAKSRTEFVLRTRKPLLLATEQEQIEWYKEFGDRALGKERQKIWRTWLGVPLVVGDKVLGVISTHHATREHAYDQNDLNILQALADQAAVALQSAESYNTAERRRQHVETVSEVTRAIIRQVELQPCLDSILDAVIRLFNAHYAAIQFIEGDDLVMVADAVPEGVGKKPERNRIRIGTGVTGKVAETDRLIRIRDVTESSFYLDYVPDTASEMAMPLRDGDTVIGVLNVESRERDAFSQEDEALFQLLAEQVVIAIQNARLFDRLREEQAKNVAAAGTAAANKMAQDVAHRMNNVATTIPVRVDQIRELLDKGNPLHFQIDGFLSRIDEAADGLLKAADRVVETARGAGESLERAEVSWLVKAAVEEKLKVTPSSIFIDNQCRAGLPRVWVPKEQFINTLVNFLQNGVDAIKANGSPGTITISSEELTERNEQWVVIEICDTGRGMAPEDIVKLGTFGFTTKKGGLGYAVWRAKELIEGLGGKLEFVSELGTGTTVRVLLPAK